jgi:type II restriction enzyme
MSFEATKREWSELYAFFRLLADGRVCFGTPDSKRDESKCRPIALIHREEHDGGRDYFIEGDNIRMVGEKGERLVPREDFATVADLILAGIKSGKSDDVTSPDGVEEFLDDIAIFDLEAKTDDRTDFSLAFYSPEAPLTGFNVRSRLCGMNPLLDGGRAANLKFEQTGVRFATPTVNKINAVPESPNEVAERMMMIERLGGVLRYSDVADKVFRSNLLMIDLHFPRLLAEMVRIMHLDGITKVAELTEVMKQTNPLKIKDELITKHCFYEFKVKQLLTTLAFGMRPAKIYNGTDSAVEGFIMVGGDGDLLCYHKSELKTFEEFLYRNTRFEKGSVEKDKYGFLERENGAYYFKLNAKIGLLKR